MKSGSIIVQGEGFLGFRGRPTFYSVLLCAFVIHCPIQGVGDRRREISRRLPSGDFKAGSRNLTNKFASHVGYGFYA